MLDLPDGVGVDWRLGLILANGVYLRNDDLLDIVDEKTFRSRLQKMTTEVMNSCGFDLHDAVGIRLAKNADLLNRKWPLYDCRKWASRLYRYRDEIPGDFLDRLLGPK